jgi:hypothetical protein
MCKKRPEGMRVMRSGATDSSTGFRPHSP